VVSSTSRSVDYTFFIEVTPISGAGADGVDGAAGAVFRDTVRDRDRICACLLPGCWPIAGCAEI